jgi:hypothetical protein
MDSANQSALSSPLALAQRLLDLTQRQAAAAAAGDWAAVNDLLDQRAAPVAAIAALDPEALDPALRADIHAALTTALDLERETTDHARRAEQELRGELARLSRGGRALRAYGMQRRRRGRLIDLPR